METQEVQEEVRWEQMDLQDLQEQEIHLLLLHLKETLVTQVLLLLMEQVVVAVELQ
jgi:hypothetical protein